MSKGFGNLVKQAQMMQQKMAKMQEDLESRHYEASAGGGMVKAVVDGKQRLQSLEINPDAVDSEDVEMLQDLVMVAVNEAIRASQEELKKEMGKMTGGMGIPGLT